MTVCATPSSREAHALEPPVASVLHHADYLQPRRGPVGRAPLDPPADWIGARPEAPRDRLAEDHDAGAPARSCGVIRGR